MCFAHALAPPEQRSKYNRQARITFMPLRLIRNLYLPAPNRPFQNRFTG